MDIMKEDREILAFCHNTACKQVHVSGHKNVSLNWAIHIHVRLVFTQQIEQHKVCRYRSAFYSVLIQINLCKNTIMWSSFNKSRLALRLSVQQLWVWLWHCKKHKYSTEVVTDLIQCFSSMKTINLIYCFKRWILLHFIALNCTCYWQQFGRHEVTLSSQRIEHYAFEQHKFLLATWKPQFLSFSSLWN